MDDWYFIIGLVSGIIGFVVYLYYVFLDFLDDELGEDEAITLVIFGGFVFVCMVIVWPLVILVGLAFFFAWRSDKRKTKVETDD